MTRDLRNPDFCREFILASLDKGLSLQKVLGKVVRSYGIKEFAKLIKMAPPNLIRAINPKHNPSNEFESPPPSPFCSVKTATYSIIPKYHFLPLSFISFLTITERYIDVLIDRYRKKRWCEARWYPVCEKGELLWFGR